LTSRRRETILRMLEKSRRGHVGSALSLVEILWVLYEEVLKFDPKDPGVLEAVNYLRGNPPKIQKVRAGKQFFPDTCRYGEGQEGLKQLICIIKGIRNNLFHGGKFPRGCIGEPGRDSKLLVTAKCVLEYVLGLDEKVKMHFDGQ